VLSECPDAGNEQEWTQQRNGGQSDTTTDGLSLRISDS